MHLADTFIKNDLQCIKSVRFYQHVRFAANAKQEHKQHVTNKNIL